MQALRQGLHSTFHRLVEWSLRYIATQVAAWVYSCGGWVKLNFVGISIRFVPYLCKTGTDNMFIFHTGCGASIWLGCRLSVICLLCFRGYCGSLRCLHQEKMISSL